MATAANSILLQLYFHATLPRNCPGRSDSNPVELEAGLLNRMLHAVRAFAPSVPIGHQSAVDELRLALATSSSRVDRESLVKQLRQLDGHRPLILYATEQNAALLVYKETILEEERVVFEAFETSAVSEKVLASENALQWDFPGHAVSIPLSAYSDNSFQESLASFVAQASAEKINKFAAVTFKAGSSKALHEVRDTSDPAVVTGLLMRILESIGTVHATPLLRKRVRDTVVFDQAYKPWRRSPYYLVLRVAMQRQLYRIFGAEIGRLYYKIIMCLFLSRLLDNGLECIPNEASHFLLQKISRRLTKLEVDRQQGSNAGKDAHDRLFGKLQNPFDTLLKTAGQYLGKNWEIHKQRTQRIIRPLPQFVSPFDKALELQLPLSGQTLDNIVFRPQNIPRLQSPFEIVQRYEKSARMKPMTAVADRYIALARFEEHSVTPIKAGSSCIEIARTIESWLSTVGDAYDGYHELKSRMLLTLMELWVSMDRDAVVCIPLLSSYHPGFTPSLLDDLHLLSLDEFRRVQEVQKYIAQRCEGCRATGSRTIFDRPSAQSFAVRFYDDSTESQRLMDLRGMIEADAQEAHAVKEAEWKQMSDEHEELLRTVARSSCLFVTRVSDYDGSTARFHDKWHCTKCASERKADRMTIKIWEDPLPSWEYTLKAAVFELALPPTFAAYRDATWLIFSSFAHGPVLSIDNVSLIHNYSGLRPYVNGVGAKVSLGSTKKSHLDCHYAKVKFPVSFEDICKPCGLIFNYFDCRSNTFTSRTSKASFSHHFPLNLPHDSPYQSLKLYCDSWPSSNQILASQTSCPADLNVHEHMACQGLLVGTHLRWLTLLRELGSQNLNFSISSTSVVVSHLIGQIGCASTNDILRDIHAVFHDCFFCKALLKQISNRLEAIHWREPILMNTIISVLLKLSSLTSVADARSHGIELLQKARSVTGAWCADIQASEVSVSVSHLAIWAAICTKRTCQLYPDVIADFDTETLNYFIRASITLQDNLMGKFHDLPHSLQNAVLEDMAFTYTIRTHLRDKILKHGHAFLAAVDSLWQLPKNFVQKEWLALPDSWWIFVTIASAQKHEEIQIFFNFVSGALLLNGEPLGKLPLEYRHDSHIQQLLGSQLPRVYPSTLPEMSLTVANHMPWGHRLHFGLRKGKVVIRAEQRGSILEYIPRNLFASDTGIFDLPMPLIAECHHWLNLNSRVIEARQGDIWKSKSGNWSICLIRRRAVRRESILVDPNSFLASRFVKNFAFFESPSQITVFQTKKGGLHVELKRLELDFRVQRQGLLQSPSLGAIIPIEQNAGTFHGSRSHLVIESASNKDQRSILVPLGRLQCRKDGHHVRVHIENHGEYVKFDINRILGRLDCPAEPMLLYMRALLHACTSHFLPDHLTGRTGKEEALYYLQSGSHQPWRPLIRGHFEPLMQIARLSPPRGYYPSNLRCMETVSWRDDLPIIVQDDRYRSLVEVICQRSSNLELFTIEENRRVHPTCPTGESHLESRALNRTFDSNPGKDQVYASRDRRIDTVEQENVAIVANLLLRWSTEFSNTSDVATLLGEFLVIGGYQNSFDRTLLTDLLSVNLGMEWGPLCNTALASSVDDKYKLMFLFTPMVFSSDAKMELIQVLISYAILPELKNLVPPAYPSFSSFKAYALPTASYLATLMQHALVPQELRHREKRGHLASVACLDFAESIRAQWPAQYIDLDKVVKPDETLVDVDAALENVMKEWSRLTQNHELSIYLRTVQSILDRFTSRRLSVPLQRNIDNAHSGLARPEIYPVRRKGGEIPLLSELLRKEFPLQKASGPALQQVPNGHPHMMKEKFYRTSRTVSRPQKSLVPVHIKELQTLVAPFRNSSFMVQNNYGRELEQSITALIQHVSQPKAVETPFNPDDLKRQVFHAGSSMRNIYNRIRERLQKEDPREKWLRHGGLWPKTTIVTLLRELRSTSKVTFGNGAKETLVNLALNVIEYQRLLRIQDASRNRKHQSLVEERANLGHENWSPLEYTDWLLLEIDGNIMIRTEQIEVALATISPESGENSVLQLLMGKGKTSCILPMVATQLANKRHLFRVVVPRPLLLQSAQVLQTKLGGLLDREVMHIPFSRKTPTDKVLIETYFQLHSHTKEHQGIIVGLPEHILSFRLSGLQCLSDNKFDEASRMIKIQARLDKYARDVLDECDVSLAIRTQLIFPSGNRVAMDGHPLRWQTIQTVLHLIRSLLPALVHQFPQSIEVVGRVVGGYPLIYFLRTDAENSLISQLVQAICKGQTSILPCAEMSPSDQKDIESFISSPKVAPAIVNRVLEMFRKKKHWMKVTYLLRGLIVHRILLSTLKKRWNVQYGLHPNRDPLAVPFHAKGVPSPSAEWGHPDVAIILTCLSFYYEGLQLNQFKQSLEHLLKSDEPGIEYEKWITKDVPESLRDYNTINVEDNYLMCELHRIILYNSHLLDFYMNNFVFPKYAKQFKTKLQTSGWDLVLYDPTSHSNCRTTGFSGTNDSRHQLPMTIKQNDIPKLSHTNAQVLAYLLETRNRRYELAVDTSGKRLSEEGLLDKLKNSGIRVLVDAGAQIIEHDNKSFARLWLNKDNEATAAVFFEADHMPWILHKKGKLIPLVTSVFADNLEKCLVYLDESHCRGTDLKLPATTRAALTLGPHLTKDNLVQAAMRLRLLGQTQSVTFYSPPEVHQSILDQRQANKHYQPDSSDVISWLLEQTCNGIEQCEPLYFTQGTSYLQRMQSKIDNPEFLQEETQLEQFLLAMRCKEAATLKQLYAPKELRGGATFHPSNFDTPLRRYAQSLHERKRDFKDRGFAVHSSALEEVELECEREVEVEVEVENVREVQKPVHYLAFKVQGLRKDIITFAKTGRLFPGSADYRGMFFALFATALGKRSALNLAATYRSKLYVSTEFERTINIWEPNDNFLRPCHWLLWSCLTETALIVSPEEADLLIPILRQDPGRTHLLVYAAPVTRRMLHFNNLDYHATPQLPPDYKAPNWLKIELGIFAGRLYFEWDEFKDIQEYLGLSSDSSSNDDIQICKRDTFAKYPLTFLHDWIAIRRKGQDFEHTPMGHLTTGKPLCADHPFFVSDSVTGKVKKGPKPAIASFAALKQEDSESEDDDDDSVDENDDSDRDIGCIADYVDSNDEGSDEDDNAFFDAEEYYDGDKK
ncbi:hypothetical protein K505DRAFT_281867 [Melanomma pulvis-pyrius CBS 109.77]|uniref:ubiquitinyl hydrolase 1 n=1 Tax=Melanomma pulvis-pyrius CBS 109.77 TaxID=1314802 RepID=A0A6A6X392_9PLEO|nr:hypothetical protein K505DRAFT_281867 [Melanomma pulvis-pyrius CBS 109.77]